MPTGEQLNIARANLVLVWVLAVLFAATMLKVAVVGQDAHAYWLTGHVDDLYRKAPRQEDAFLYSPAFALLVWPLTLLPWPIFLGVWVVVESTALVWLLKPMAARWAIPAFLFCVPELLIGNVYILQALMVALGIRYPAAWTFGFLTKLTTGVGLLWFVARGEWRQFAWGLSVTGSIVIGTYVFVPALWHEWLAFLVGNSGESGDGLAGVIARWIVALGLVAVAARKDLPWLLAPAVLLASPVLNAFAALTVLAAIPRLRQQRTNQPSRSAPLPSQSVALD